MTPHPQPIKSTDFNKCDSNEIDFIDVLAFGWRWKKWVAGSFATGLAVGALIYTIKLSRNNSEIIGSKKWHVIFSTASSENANATPAEISSFFSTSLGSKAFYHTLAADKSLQINESDLAAKQQEGTGLLQSISPHSQGIEITLMAPANWSEEQIEKSMLPAINQVVDLYNSTYVEPTQKIESEVMESQIEASRIKFEALKLFEKATAANPGLQKVLLESLTKRLYDDDAQQLVVFMAANAPGNQPIQENIMKVTSLQKKIELLKKEELNYLKLSGSKEILPIVKVANLKENSALNDGPTTQTVAPTLRLLAFMAVAALFFSFVAIALILTSNLIIANKDRFISKAN